MKRMIGSDAEALQGAGGTLAGEVAAVVPEAARRPLRELMDDRLLDALLAQVEASAVPVSRARAVASYPWLMNSHSAVSKVAAGPLRIRWQGAGGGAV